MCSICEQRPGAHSFEFSFTRDEIPGFYTCPEKASEYWDGKAIIAHMKLVLAQHGVPTTKPWIWIFDAHGFGLKHVLEIGVAMDLLTFFRDDVTGQALHHVEIIRPNTVLQHFLALLQPFMTPEIKNKIQF